MDLHLKKALENVRENYPTSIVEPYNGYVVIATDGYDLEAKKNKIAIGQTYGFYTIEKAYALKPFPKENTFSWMRFFAKIGCATTMLIPVAIVIYIFYLIF